MNLRFREIDFLYAIGVLLVVFGHSHPSDWSQFSGSIHEKLITFIYRFHMPLFYMLAGFTFRNSEKAFVISYRQWIKEKTARLLIPYFALSLIAMLPKGLLEHTVVASDVPRQIMDLFLYPRLGVWGHLWFIPTLVIAYALFGAWVRCTVGPSGWRKCAITLLVTGSFYFIPWSSQFLCFDDVKTALLFFVFGMGFRDIITKARFLQSKLQAVLTAVCCVLASAALSRGASGARWADCIIALLMFFSLWQIGTWIGEHEAIRWLSKHNFTMYLYSWPFQAVVMALGQYFKISWQAVSALMFISGILGPAILVAFFERVTKMKCRLPALVLGLKRE